MMKNERGFTIMELLVVIVIIGVLAAIGVPAYKSMTEKAKQAACDATRHTLQTGVAMHYADKGSYPDNTGAAIADYIDNAATITCPDGGTYTVDGVTGEVYCDKHHKEGGGS